MSDQPTIPPGEAWSNYRLLVLAELERLDRRMDEINRKLASQSETLSEVKAQFEKETEVIHARYVGFTKEVGQLYKTAPEIRSIAKSVFNESMPDPGESSVANIRGMWEFRAAAITALAGLIIAIIGLVA